MNARKNDSEKLLNIYKRFLNKCVRDRRKLQRIYNECAENETEIKDKLQNKIDDILNEIVYYKKLISYFEGV